MADKNGKDGKNGARDGPIDSALREGLAQVGQQELARPAEARLSSAEQRLVMELVNVLGLSVRSVLNASIRYALHYAQARGVAPTAPREYPHTLEGEPISFLLSPETLVRLDEADMTEHVAACALAGLRLLHGKTLNIKVAR